MATRTAEEIGLDSPGWAAFLLEKLWEVGQCRALAKLAWRAADDVSLYPKEVAMLLEKLWGSGRPKLS
ncbi:hypothetical protein [Streptomyces collinus]|uniref:hypothetical protein n=1 Tax=Streptomyces collinus TaxID=42684 RepID=UPI003334161D